MHRVTSLFLCDTYYFVHHFLKIKIKNCFFCSVHHSPSIKWTVYIISLTGSFLYLIFLWPKLSVQSVFFHWSFSLITQKIKCQLMGVQTLLEKGPQSSFHKQSAFSHLRHIFQTFQISQKDLLKACEMWWQQRIFYARYNFSNFQSLWHKFTKSLPSI